MNIEEKTKYSAEEVKQLEKYRREAAKRKWMGNSLIIKNRFLQLLVGWLIFIIVIGTIYWLAFSGETTSPTIEEWWGPTWR